MSEARRHSVDIPLSKTLVALKRVRSLRDPSTNSMTNFNSFAENLSWETNSCNGISLKFEPKVEGGSSDNHSIRSLHNSYKHGGREEIESDFELGYSKKIANSKFDSSKKSARVGIRGTDLKGTKRVEELGLSRLSFDGIYENKLFCERDDRNHRFKPSALTWIHCSGNCLKQDIDSYSEPNLESARSRRIDSAMSKRKSRYGKLVKSSVAVDDVVSSRVGSPYQSESDARMDGLSINTSLFEKEEVDALGPSHCGCGISQCWSRTPINVEEHPLLSSEVRETDHLVWERNTYLKGEVTMYSGNPRSLSEKFRPKFFDEVVGQHVVTQSLLSAISKGKISSIYIFHGPRGTGKTSTSRIFAAALNCLSLQEHGPCGFCRECILFFSGRGRDVKEMNAAKLNRIGRFKSLLKNAAVAPVSSQFKIFIVDECQFLRGEIWAAFLNSLEEIPRHVIFIMITADMDKLPRSAISRCQRYHFAKIRDADIVSRLRKICVEETLEYDEAALDFVASKSNGSLRDAEAVLDQLSLLGKRITISLAYDLNGMVSDDELLDLLDLALSSDTSNTVRRARELMRSRIDPMQLISQLANIIMDILAGRCRLGSSEAEVDSPKLRNALKILSETEKQLRTSKNQTTWLTVALLQFSAGESSSFLDRSDSRTSLKNTCKIVDGLCSTSSAMENLKHSSSYVHSHNDSYHSEIHSDTSRELETIWRRTIEKCQSNTLRRFLQKEGKLSSVCVNQGMAIAVVEFCHPDHVSRAEKSWKLIASSLQHVLGCNVEIRIKPCPQTKNVKVKKPSCNFLSCSVRMQEKSVSTTVNEHGHLDDSKKQMPVEPDSLDHGSQFSPCMQHSDAIQVCETIHFYHKDAVTIRNVEGNALQTGPTTPHRTMQNDPPNGCKVPMDFSKETNTHGYNDIQEPEIQPCCFSKTVKFKRILHPSDVVSTICLRMQPNKKLELSIPKQTSFETCVCTTDPFIIGSNTNTQIAYSNSSRDGDGPSKDSGVNSKMHCWRAPNFPNRKAWLHRRQKRRKSHLVGWILPCSTAKKSAE
ncbi:protein STICHEL-like 2 isoform X2 [Tasmannia lanceolata]|uniref:protein STICHEL-like 2 isoform X2 n=1 Tax=Tasmannia lanceolata TaxID=3420 RepID=UPI004064483D